MKKLFLLTSIFALAACGGGGGGGGGSSYVAPRAAMDPTSQTAIDVADSNRHVTSMASEVLVASDGTWSSPLLGRSAAATYNGQSYTSYRLDDVTFKIGGEDSYVKFGVDSDGKIISAAKYDKNDMGPGYVLSEEGRFARDGDTSDFKKNLYHYEYHVDNTGIPAIAAEHFGTVDFLDDSGALTTAQIKKKLIAKIEKKINKVIASQDPGNPTYDTDVAALQSALTLYKSQINGQSSFSAPVTGHARLTVSGVNNSASGLKYADLGIAELVLMNEAETVNLQQIITPYVGGYNKLKVNQADLSDDMKFTGTVVAGIERSAKVAGEKQPKTSVYVRDDSAYLNMRRDGTADLVMNNLNNTKAGHTSEHWYKLMVQKGSGSASIPVVTVSGTNTITEYDLPNKGVSDWTIPFTSEDYSASEQEYIKNVGSEGSGTRQGAFIETTAYGLSATDPNMEATMRFGFSDGTYSNNNQDQTEVAIYGAFGGGSPTPIE